MHRLTFLLFAAAVLTLAAGCGQSGPLYLPGDPSTIVEQPGASSDGSADSEEETRDDDGDDQ